MNSATAAHTRARQPRARRSGGAGRLASNLIVAGIALTIGLFLVTGFENIAPSVLSAASFTFFILVLLTNTDNSELYSPIFCLTFVYGAFLLLGAAFFDVMRPGSFFESSTRFINVGFLCMLLGLCLPTALLGNRRADGPPVFVTAKSRQVLYGLLGVSLLAYLVLVGLSGLPVLSANINQARIDFLAGKGFIALFYHASAIVNLALLYDAIGRNRKRQILASHVIMGLIALSYLLIGARGATLAVGVSYAFFYIYLKQIRINLLLVFAAAIVGLLFLAALGSLRRFGGLSLDGMTQETVIILTARPAANQLILNKLQQFDAFGAGAYFENALRLIPGYSVNTNLQLREIVLGTNTFMPSSAGVNPSIVGEAVVNLGPIGLVFVPFLFGLIMVLFFLWMKRRPTFFRMALYFTFVAYSIIAITSGIGARMPDFVIATFWVSIVNLFYRNKLV